MWSRWLAAWQQGTTFNQVFVTASATLQDQVRWRGEAGRALLNRL
jgi:hypothetical protein